MTKRCLHILLITTIALYQLSCSSGTSIPNDGNGSNRSAISNNQAEGVALKSDKDKLSYAIGIQIAENLKRDGIDVSGQVVAQAIDDLLTDKDLALNPDQIREVMENLSKRIISKQQGVQMQASEEHIKLGKAYLEENAKKEGVTVTDSGLQYRVITPGTGDQPKSKNDVVNVHYRGTLLDGTEFDSSYKRGEPISFPLNRVIAGWTEGVQLMQVGAKWELTIPYNLAYGLQGSPPVIPPGATLIFEIELLGIEN